MDVPSALPAAFPVKLSDENRRFYALCPRSVPYRFLRAHEARAERNYGGSLVELALDGGLDPVELVAVLNDSPVPPLAIMRREGSKLLAQAVAELVRRLAAWLARPANTPAADVRLAPAWRCEFCSADNVIELPAPARVGCWMCKQQFVPVLRPGVEGDEIPAPADERPGESGREGPAAGRAGSGG